VRRGIVLLLFVTLFVSETSWSAVAPLLPSFAERFHLDGSRTGFILSIASLAILAISIPAGRLVHRFGVRRVTVASGVAMTLGNAILALSAGYGALLAGRAVFGLGLGTLWVGGTSWLHVASGDRSARTLSMTSAIIGAGSLVGPGFAGIVSDRFGPGVPFGVIAVATAVATIALWRSPRAEDERPDEPAGLTALLRAASRDDAVRASVALMFVGSLLWLSSYVLIPTRLHAAGWSAADIGVAFSVSSLVYGAISWVVAHRADRAATLTVASVATAALAASLGVVVVSTTVPATVGFLMLAGVVTGVMIAITFPLGVAGAVPVALVGGLLNVAWSTAGLLGPPLAGAASDAVGDRATFAVLAAVTALVATWISVAARRTSRPRVAT
jgi:MFS family permease